jgi:hypothetical protein
MKSSINIRFKCGEMIDVIADLLTYIDQTQVLPALNASRRKLLSCL